MTFLSFFFLFNYRYIIICFISRWYRAVIFNTYRRLSYSMISGTIGVGVNATLTSKGVITHSPTASLGAWVVPKRIIPCHTHQNSWKHSGDLEEFEAWLDFLACYTVVQKRTPFIFPRLLDVLKNKCLVTSRPPAPSTAHFFGKALA